jgi:hypothetical protein
MFLPHAYFTRPTCHFRLPLTVFCSLLLCSCICPAPAFCSSSAPVLDTEVSVVEEFFKKLTSREDIAIVLINQSVANDIRHLIREYTKMIPTLLEIPSKDQAYDPDQVR